MAGTISSAISGLIRCWTFNTSQCILFFNIRSKREISKLKSRASLYTAGEGRNCLWSPAYKPQSYNVSRGQVARVWSSPSSPSDEKNKWSSVSTPPIFIRWCINTDTSFTFNLRLQFPHVCRNLRCSNYQQWYRINEDRIYFKVLSQHQSQKTDGEKAKINKMNALKFIGNVIIRAKTSYIMQW